MRPFSSSSFVLLLGGLLATANSSAQNAYITNAFMPRYAKAATDYPINVRVRNSDAATPVYSYRVDWRWNNGPIQMGDFQNSTGIHPGEYMPYAHPIAFAEPQGVGVLQMWVVGPGDTDHTNDTLTFPMGMLSNWAVKNVLIEQFTGTWCQFCPPPNALTNTLDADPVVVVAKHHNADEFSNTGSTEYWNQYNSNISPTAVLEQGEGGTYLANANYDQWTAEVELRKTGVSPVNLSITPEFNYWTRELTVDLSATFTYGLTNEFILNAYIVEDNVPGPQTNAPAGYIHQQVVRQVLGGGSGTSGVIPGTTVAGVPYTHSYTFSVPSEWNADNLRIIGTVSQRQGSTLHAVNVGSATFISVGIGERNDISAALSVYPNPSSTDLWITLPGERAQATVKVIAADGREVMSRQLVLGTEAVRLDGFETLAAGAYTVRVLRADAFAEQRVVKL